MPPNIDPSKVVSAPVQIQPSAEKPVQEEPKKGQLGVVTVAPVAAQPVSCPLVGAVACNTSMAATGIFAAGAGITLLTASLNPAIYAAAPYLYKIGYGILGVTGSFLATEAACTVAAVATYQHLKRQTHPQKLEFNALPESKTAPVTVQPTSGYQMTMENSVRFPSYRSTVEEIDLLTVQEDNKQDDLHGESRTFFYAYVHNTYNRDISKDTIASCIQRRLDVLKTMITSPSGPLQAEFDTLSNYLAALPNTHLQIAGDQVKA